MVEFICQFVCYNFPLVLCRAVNIQLGQANVNPPDLCLKRGDSNSAGTHAWRAEVPQLVEL